MRIIGPIPPHILEKMDPKDRPPGVAGMTPGEVHAKQVAQAEKALQDDVRRYLNLLRLPFINPPMNKKSTLPLGWLDFTVFLPRGVVVLWECKAVGGSLRPEQCAVRDELLILGHRWRLIRSLGEAQTHMREIEAEVVK
jgi:hypothetical protein